MRPCARPLYGGVEPTFYQPRARALAVAIATVGFLGCVGLVGRARAPLPLANCHVLFVVDHDLRSAVDRHRLQPRRHVDRPAGRAIHELEALVQVERRRVGERRQRDAIAPERPARRLGDLHQVRADRLRKRADERDVQVPPLECAARRHAHLVLEGGRVQQLEKDVALLVGVEVVPVGRAHELLVVLPPLDRAELLAVGVPPSVAHGLEHVLNPIAVIGPEVPESRSDRHRAAAHRREDHALARAERDRQHALQVRVGGRRRRARRGRQCLEHVVAVDRAVDAVVVHGRVGVAGRVARVLQAVLVLGDIVLDQVLERRRAGRRRLQVQPRQVGERHRPRLH